MTLEQLRKIMTHMPQERAEKYWPFLEKAMAEVAINTPLRQAAFLAQIAHESNELLYMSEIWGPTEQQKKYDPPNPLAAKLGNTQAGDGFKYRGAGPLQLTGRANYREYGKELGLDLENNPDLARTPETGLRIACRYWVKRGLNELADAKDFDKITLRINGGYLGKQSRDQYYATAKTVLGV